MSQAASVSPSAMCSPTVEGQGRHSPVGLVGAVDAAVVAHAHVRGAGVVAHVTPEQPLRRAPASCWTKPLLTELHPALGQLSDYHFITTEL